MKKLFNDLKIRLNYKLKESKEFFVMTNAWKNGYLWVVSDLKFPPIENNMSREEELNEFNRRRKKQIKFLKQNQTKLFIGGGSKEGDILPNGAINLFSKRLFDLLTKKKIKGPKFYPIVINSKKSLQRYYYVEPRYKCRDISSKNYSEPKGLLKISENCYFNINDWNGDDIFGIGGTLILVVTKNLKELIEKGKMSNISFRPIEEFKKRI